MYLVSYVHFGGKSIHSFKTFINYPIQYCFYKINLIFVNLISIAFLRFDTLLQFIVFLSETLIYNLNRPYIME